MQTKAVFLNGWSGGDRRLLLEWFELEPEQLRGTEILLASYWEDEEGGQAFVLFRRGGGLFEVNASHATDERFQGQWEPEETFPAVLRHRLEKGRLGRGGRGEPLFVKELEALLQLLDEEVQ